MPIPMIVGLAIGLAVALPEQSYTAPVQLALRDLQLLDGAMATLALSAGLAVLALDTTGSQS